MPLLVYHLTLSSQGGWVRCGVCGSLDAWSAEFGADSETVTHYLCAYCQRFWIGARDVVETTYADPRLDALVADAGDALRTGFTHLHEMAEAAGLAEHVRQLDEWMGEGG